MSDYEVKQMITVGFPQVSLVIPIKDVKIIFHNTAGTASAHQEALRVQNEAVFRKGNAHFWVDDKEVWQTVSYHITAWHLGDYYWNQRTIGVEVCKSRADEDTFKKAEENALSFISNFCKQVGIDPNVRDVIDIHANYIATACPHRTQDLHGKGQLAIDYLNNRLRDIYNDKNVKVNVESSLYITKNKYTQLWHTSLRRVGGGFDDRGNILDYKAIGRLGQRINQSSEFYIGDILMGWISDQDIELYTEIAQQEVEKPNLNLELLLKEKDKVIKKLESKLKSIKDILN